MSNKEDTECIYQLKLTQLTSHTQFLQYWKSSLAKSAPYQPMFQPPVLSPGSDMLEQEPEEVKLGCRTNRSSVRTRFPLGGVRHNAQGHKLTYRL